MLRWTSGVTRFDHIQNEDILDRYEVAPIVEKLREAPSIYGHVNRANENSLAKIGLNIEVDGEGTPNLYSEIWLKEGKP